MTVPPLIELAHLTPRFWRWLINLTWVRYVTRRPAPGVPGPEEIGSPDTEFLDEKKGIIDDQSSFMDELPLLGRTQKSDHSDEITEKGQSQFPCLQPIVVLPLSSLQYRNIIPDHLSNSTDTLLDDHS